MEQAISKTKFKKVKIIATVLVAALILSLLTPIFSKAGESQIQCNNSKITIGAFDLWADLDGDGLVEDNEYFIKDGQQVVDSSTQIKQGTKIKYDIPWNVDSENYAKFEQGEQFTINLPSGAFSYTTISTPKSVTSEVKLIDNDGEEKTESYTIGSYIMTNTTGPKLTFTFDDELIANEDIDQIYDGHVQGLGSVVTNKEGETGFTFGADYTINITKVESGQASNVLGATTSSNPIGKTGFISNGNTGIYTINVGHDQMVRLFNTGEYKQRSNVILEDQLEPGQTFKSFSAGVMYRYARPSDKALSIAKIYGDTGVDVTNQFGTPIAQKDGESYDAFKKRVTEAEAPCYGVWDDINIVINLGDMPGSIDMPVPIDRLTEVLNKDYDSNDKAPHAIGYNNRTEKMAEYYGLDLAEFRQANIEAYSDYYTNSKGKSPALCIVIATDIFGETRMISNSVTMTGTDMDDAVGKTGQMAFTSIDVSAKVSLARSVKITKIDGDEGTELNNVSFKLQRKGENGEYADYTPQDGTDIIKNTTGGSVWYNKLALGDYKIIEVDNPIEGYTDEVKFVTSAALNENGEFTITSDSNNAVYVTVENYKADDEGDDEEQVVTDSGIISNDTVKEDVQGEEATPTAIVDGDNDNQVLGEEGNPENENGDGDVLGEEAKTSDTMNMITLLLAAGLATLLILFLIAGKRFKKE